MKQTLEKLFNYHTLTVDEAAQMLHAIADGDFAPTQIAAFLTVFRMRSITVQELQGFRQALNERSTNVKLEADKRIDLCGTGGDGKDTFNISTLSSFVVAGAGYKVTKHGNYGVSSVCGSSNVLEAMGCHFTTDESRLNQQLDQANICILHAPLFHPAMKAVAPIRKSIGIKTFFNMLGPLVNPSNPSHQMVGVFNLDLARLYQYMLQKSDQRYTIIHSIDGYDEISLTGDFKCFYDGKEYLFSPETIGLQQQNAADLKGGSSVEEAAKIFNTIIDGSGTEAQNQAVIANAGMAIKTIAEDISLADAQAAAKESLTSGKAAQSLQKFLVLQS